MPTSKQRREAQRRHLERQLQRRQERESRRKRTTLIASIVGTVVLIAVVIGLVVGLSGNDKKTTTAADGSGTPTPSTSASAPASESPSAVRPATGPAVTFEGVTVTGAKDLGGSPGVTSKSTKTPTKLLYKDLVVGTGPAADPKSTVTVHYTGVLYKDGKKFDSSWDRGQPIPFSLQQVVPGFTQGIGGGEGVPPMKVGGRRIIIMPAALGYGSQGNSSIPPNSPLVFVVDLKAVQG